MFGKEKADDIIYRLRCVESNSEDVQEGDVLPVYYSCGNEYVYIRRKKVYVGCDLDMYGDFVTD